MVLVAGIQRELGKIGRFHPGANPEPVQGPGDDFLLPCPQWRFHIIDNQHGFSFLTQKRGAARRQSLPYQARQEAGSLGVTSMSAEYSPTAQASTLPWT